MSLSKIVGENTLLSAAIFNNYSNDRLYYLGNAFEQLQLLEDGILIIATSNLNSYSFFLKTEEKNPDGYRFTDKDFVFIDGLYEYESLTGRKTVYKLIHVKALKEYYFI